MKVTVRKIIVSFKIGKFRFLKKLPFTAQFIALVTSNSKSISQSNVPKKVSKFHDICLNIKESCLDGVICLQAYVRNTGNNSLISLGFVLF